MTYSSSSDKFNGSSYDSGRGEVGSKESARGAAGGRWPPRRARRCDNAQPAGGKLTAPEVERHGRGREHLLLHPRSAAQARQSEGTSGRTKGWQKGSLKASHKALQLRGSDRSPAPWQKPHPFRQAKTSCRHCWSSSASRGGASNRRRALGVDEIAAFHQPSPAPGPPSC